jgi:hypothetical protein
VGAPQIPDSQTGSGPDSGDLCRRSTRRLCPDGRACGTAPLLGAFIGWAEATAAKLSAKSNLAEAFRYAIDRWEALSRSITDGRLGADHQVPAATLSAARPCGRHPGKRDPRVEESRVRCCRSDEPARTRCRSVGGPSCGSMREQRRPHRVSPRHARRGRAESVSDGARSKHSFGISHYLRR